MLIAVATVTLWIGTRKGAFALRSDERRRSWTLSSPQFLGHTIHHIVQDPRDPKSLLMAAKTGHLGPTVYRSADRGRKWREAATPPAFRKAVNSEPPRAVERVFWLTPGHEREPGVWYAGPRPRDCFAPKTAANTGRRSPASTITRCERNGHRDRERRTASCCIRYWSIRVMPGIFIWPYRSVASLNRPMAASIGCR